MNLKNLRIFLVEDDPSLGEILQEYLEAKSFNVVRRTDGESASETYKPQNFDLILLDVMLPKKDGFTFAKEIQENYQNNPPIIFLTAKGEKEDRLEGFKRGADDYLTKPFSMEELLYRIQAIFRRMNEGSYIDLGNENFQIGNYSFDARYQVLKMQNEERKLSTKENDLLKMLCQYKNKLLPRDTALINIWGENDYFTGRSMDVYITKLRKYLKDDPSITIMNEHGKGYKLLVDE